MYKYDYATVLQLSHLLALEIGLNGDESTIIDTICQAKPPVNENNLHELVLALFNVSFENDRLAATIERLIKSNKLFRSGNTLVIAPDIMEEINRVTAENERIEKVALSEWVTQFENAVCICFSENDHQIIRDSILGFIRTFFLTHGADCYSFVVGQKQNEFFDIDLIAHSQSKLADPDHANALAEFMAGIFTFDPTTAQRAFLLTQLKKAVSYLSMVIDDGAKTAIMHRVEGVTIYLDTSILYRLLNLQGEKRYEPIHRLVKYCQRWGVSLKVLSTSIEEMKRRIDYDSRVIIAHPIPVSFASIGYKWRISENYISTYWKAASETGITPRDFNAKFDDIVGLLADLGVETDATDYISVFGLEEIVSDLEAKIARYENPDPEYKKTPKALKHDAQCLAIIEKLQEPNAKNAIDAKTLFLSSDWTLIRLQRSDFQYKNKTDMVVLPSQMLQLFCMTSPIQDYMEAFLGLFSSSRTYFGANTLPNEKLQEIIGRIAAFRGTTPAYAERVLTSRLIQASFSQQETEEERIALIDSAMILEVEEMEQELGVKAEALEVARSDAEDKRATINGLEGRIVMLEEAQANAARKMRTNQIYEKHLHQKAESKGKILAASLFACGTLLLLFGMGCLLVCILGIIPNTYAIVEPCYVWIKSSPVLSNDTNGGIVAIGITLALAAISGGFSFVKPGYAKMKASFTEIEWKRICEKLGVE